MLEKHYSKKGYVCEAILLLIVVRYFMNIIEIIMVVRNIHKKPVFVIEWYFKNFKHINIIQRPNVASFLLTKRRQISQTKASGVKCVLSVAPKSN